MLNEEERMLRAAVREFAERDVAPHASAIDEAEYFSMDTWKGMARMGLFGLALDPKFGGGGGGIKSVAVVTEEIARVCAATAVTYLVQVALAGYPISTFGNDKQKARWLAPIISGETIGAFCLTEPTSGSDAAAASTIAKKVNGGYSLSGSKTFITNGSVGNTLVVFATTDRKLKHKGFVSLVLDRQMKGITAQKITGKMGIRGSDTATIFFDNVEVPEDHRLGNEGDGFKVAMQTLDHSRIAIAAQAVGIAQGAYEEAVRHAKQRQAFGKAIAEFQAIQFYLADMAMRLEASRLLTYQAATLKDSGQPFVKHASMAKAFASESSVFITDRAVQIFGGYGYIREAKVERFYRDARVTPIYEGTSEIQRLMITRYLLQET
ncbi:MAG: acyl-CoA dehydrogenase [Dehalococcoidia bacterium]|nr:acyl-CoA dehydrogenase [Dehalococcoidia bacterium]